MTARTPIGGPRPDGCGSHALPPATGLRFLVLFAREARLMPHSLDHVRARHNGGFDAVALVIVDPLVAIGDTALLDWRWQESTGSI